MTPLVMPEALQRLLTRPAAPEPAAPEPAAPEPDPTPGWPRCRLCGKRLDPDRPLVQELNSWTGETSHACLGCYTKTGTIIGFGASDDRAG